MLYQLSYSRMQWRRKESNLRSHPTTDLQSVPFGRLGTPPKVKIKSWQQELNPQPAPYKGAALPLSYASKKFY